MTRIPFVKAHACGNDFLILEENQGESLAGNPHAALARKLCSRNTGIGADGIEFLDRLPNNEFFIRLFNSDGSEAELSGNGMFQGDHRQRMTKHGRGLGTSDDLDRNLQAQV